MKINGMLAIILNYAVNIYNMKIVIYEWIILIPLLDLTLVMN